MLYDHGRWDYEDEVNVTLCRRWSQHVFVVMSIYVKRVEQEHGEPEIFIVHMGQCRTLRRCAAGT